MNGIFGVCDDDEDPRKSKKGIKHAILLIPKRKMSLNDEKEHSFKKDIEHHVINLND